MRASRLPSSISASDNHIVPLAKLIITVMEGSPAHIIE
jgi:hypothetical protein